jgi:hypothetical protein
MKLCCHLLIMTDKTSHWLSSDDYARQLWFISDDFYRLDIIPHPQNKYIRLLSVESKKYTKMINSLSYEMPLKKN